MLGRRTEEEAREPRRGLSRNARIALGFAAAAAIGYVIYLAAQPKTEAEKKKAEVEKKKDATDTAETIAEAARRRYEDERKRLEEERRRLEEAEAAAAAAKAAEEKAADEAAAEARRQIYLVPKGRPTHFLSGSGDALGAPTLMPNVDRGPHHAWIMNEEEGGYVSFRSALDRGYLAWNDMTKQLVKNERLGSWEKWRRLPMVDGSSILVAHTGNHLSASPSGVVSAAHTNTGDWERWDVVPVVANERRPRRHAYAPRR